MLNNVTKFHKILIKAIQLKRGRRSVGHTDGQGLHLMPGPLSWRVGGGGGGGVGGGIKWAITQSNFANISKFELDLHLTMLYLPSVNFE